MVISDKLIDFKIAFNELEGMLHSLLHNLGSTIFVIGFLSHNYFVKIP